MSAGEDATLQLAAALLAALVVPFFIGHTLVWNLIFRSGRHAAPVGGAKQRGGFARAFFALTFALSLDVMVMTIAEVAELLDDFTRLLAWQLVLVALIVDLVRPQRSWP